MSSALKIDMRIKAVFSWEDDYWVDDSCDLAWYPDNPHQIDLLIPFRLHTPDQIVSLDLLSAAMSAPGNHGKGRVRIEADEYLVTITFQGAATRDRICIRFSRMDALRFLKQVRRRLLMLTHPEENIDEEWRLFNEQGGPR